MIVATQQLVSFCDAIKEIFRHEVGIYAEDMQHNLDLVVEGQQMLAERVDRLEGQLRGEISRVDQRLTAVHADLVAHRRDTEAHTVYRVKE
ncbi:MAG: hypothetical protein RQ723_00445 [Desulfuromonadales bacterium]|nr:hypothetical protein [Desulfuromonadales bacterium]